MRSFARSFVIATAAVIGAAAVALPLFNILVDPYRAFGTPEIPGITGVKPEMTNRGRLSKTYALCSRRPDTVLMGSSRNEFLFNPSSPLVREISKNPYNLALAGTNIYEIDLMLRHAYFASGHLKTAIVGIDFLMFNASREAESVKREIVDFDLDRLVLSDRDSCLASYAREANDLLLSAPTIAASVKTLQTQYFHELYLADGMRHPYYNGLSASLRRPIVQWIGLIGQARAYLQLIWLPPPAHNFCFTSPDKSISTLAVFRDMVKFAREKGIKLTFMINPEHMALAIAMKEGGLWPTYELWKRKIVEILADDGDQHGDAGFDLFDFTGMNEITAEAASRSDPSFRMNYWYEGSHSTQVVGEMMLERALHGTIRPEAENFGVRLTPESLDGALSAARAALDRYYGLREELVADMKDVVKALDLGHAQACPADDTGPLALSYVP